MSIDKDNSSSGINFTSSHLEITLDKSTFKLKKNIPKYRKILVKTCKKFGMV